MVPVIGFELMTYRFIILNHFQVDNNCRENLDFLFILLIKINLDAPRQVSTRSPKRYFARDCHFKGFPEFEECSSQCFQRELQFNLQGGCSTTELNRHGLNITCAGRYFLIFLLFTNIMLKFFIKHC